MAFYRAAVGGGGTGGGTPSVLKFLTGTTSITASVTGNTSGTLYAYTYTSSSNLTYRENNTSISSTSGCSYSLINSWTSGTSLLRLYKLTNCQSSVSVTVNSTTSAVGKNIILFKIT